MPRAFRASQALGAPGRCCRYPAWAVRSHGIVCGEKRKGIALSERRPPRAVLCSIQHLLQLMQQPRSASLAPWARPCTPCQARRAPQTFQLWDPASHSRPPIAPDQLQPCASCSSPALPFAPWCWPAARTRCCCGPAACCRWICPPSGARPSHRCRSGRGARCRSVGAAARPAGRAQGNLKWAAGPAVGVAGAPHPPPAPPLPTSNRRERSACGHRANPANASLLPAPPNSTGGDPR